MHWRNFECQTINTYLCNSFYRNLFLLNHYCLFVCIYWFGFSLIFDLLLFLSWLSWISTVSSPPLSKGSVMWCDSSLGVGWMIFHTSIVQILIFVNLISLCFSIFYIVLLKAADSSFNIIHHKVLGLCALLSIRRELEGNTSLRWAIRPLQVIGK